MGYKEAKGVGKAARRRKTPCAEFRVKSAKNTPAQSKIGTIGVSFDPKRGGKDYKARIHFKGKEITVGRYRSCHEAMLAHDQAMIMMIGYRLPIRMNLPANDSDFHDPAVEQKMQALIATARSLPAADLEAAAAAPYQPQQIAELLRAASSASSSNESCDSAMQAAVQQKRKQQCQEQKQATMLQSPLATTDPSTHSTPSESSVSDCCLRREPSIHSSSSSCSDQSRHSANDPLATDVWARCSSNHHQQSQHLLSTPHSNVHLQQQQQQQFLVQQHQQTQQQQQHWQYQSPETTDRGIDSLANFYLDSRQQAGVACNSSSLQCSTEELLESMLHLPPLTEVGFIDLLLS